MTTGPKTGMISQLPLAASVILSLLAVTGMYLLPSEETQTEFMLTPSTFVSAPGETFTVQIVTTSDTPVNAFKGTVTFNEQVLVVKSINYNTSLADLWAEEPWYKSGAGTIEFAGGTLKAGGFTGTGTLLSITFSARAAGSGNLVLSHTQILMHDGQGTEAVLTDYIDTLFSVSTEVPIEIIAHEVRSVAEVVVLSKLPTPDLNTDGLVTITDVSLFLLLLSSGNPTADFNADGKVNTADLSILLKAKNR